MLSILLNGTRFHLPSDFQLALVFENPLFIQDRIPTNHSLTLNLPASDHNLSMLGYPNRLHSLQGFKEYSGCQIRFGPVILLKGVLVVQKWDRVIRAFFRAATLTDEVRKPLNETSLDRYDFPVGNRFNPDFDTPGALGYEYKSRIFNSLDGSDDFAAAPVKILDVEWAHDDNPIPEAFGNFNTQRLYFSYFNPENGNYMLTDGVTDSHTVIFPQPFFHYLLTKTFGSALVNNPFTSDGLEKLCVVNTFHPKYTEGIMSNFRGILLDSDYQDDAIENYLLLASFCARMQVNDILKDVLKMICATLFISGDRFDIRYNEDIMNATDMVNWTRKLVGRPSHEKQPGQAYVYGYSGIPDHIVPENVTEVDTIEDLLAEVVPEDEEKEIYVTSTQQTYIVSILSKADPEDPDRYHYEVKHSGYGGSQGGSDSFNMVSGVTPLDMSIHDWWWENSNGAGIALGKWFVPEWSGDRNARPETPNIMLFHGLKDTLSTGQYPYMSGYDVDAAGNESNNFSLAWEGEKGLIATFHQAFKEWVEKDKSRIEAGFILDAVDLRNLDFTIKHHVKGKNFYIERVEVSIGLKKISPARVSLIEA